MVPKVHWRCLWQFRKAWTGKWPWGHCGRSPTLQSLVCNGDHLESAVRKVKGSERIQPSSHLSWIIPMPQMAWPEHQVFLVLCGWPVMTGLHQLTIFFLGDRGSISQKWAPRTVCFCSAEPFCAEIKWTPSSPLLFKWQLCVAAAVSKLQIACPQCLLAPDRCTLSPPGFSLMLTGLICWGLRNAALCGLLKSGTPFWIHVMVLLGPLLETQTNLGC